MLANITAPWQYDCQSILMTLAALIQAGGAVHEAVLTVYVRPVIIHRPPVWTS